MSLLWLGLLPGLAACGFTFLYGAKDIPNLMPLILKVEDLGFTPRLQKLIIVGCWGVLWLFLFFSMSVYSAMIPDTLGWGLVEVCTLLQWCTALFSLSLTSLFPLSLFGTARGLLWPPPLRLHPNLHLWRDISLVPLLTLVA